MDKVYKKYKEAKMNPQKFMDELGIDIAEGDNLGMGVVRKETDLNNDEKQFLLAMERGDIPTARHFLEEAQIYFNININCVDPLGRTALLIAIENENIEMIELLLSYNVELGDALLHAINEENVEAVEMLLSHQQLNKKDLSEKKSTDSVLAKLKPATADADGEPPKEKSTMLNVLSRLRGKPVVEGETEGFLGGVPSSSFTQDITPIILAGHRDNYEIIKILLDRGDRIQKPHDVRCRCTECITRCNEDSLNHSRSRINAYRALASPSLIALSSKDPILTAFELSWELKRLSRLENEFKLEYETLAKQCRDFAVALLDQTRGSKELETVLNHDTNGPVGEDGDRMNLARLKLAIKFKQKKFVAHPNCQQLLASLWYEGLPGFRRKHIALKVMLTVTVSFGYPLLSVLYILFPKTALGHFMRQPFIKFICHSASYMTFLFMLVLASQRIESLISFMQESDKVSREIRGSTPTIIEWVIISYVAGLIWIEIKQLWSEGVKAYIQDMWNILDFTTNSLYIATFTLKLIAYLRVRQEIADGNPAAYANREDWDGFDPNLVSEGLFASANVFSTLKLVYIFTVNPHLGPLQITLGRMINDILKFAFIVILVIVSFACGLNQLYWYYAAERQKDCQECLSLMENQRECDQPCDKTLANLWEILQTLYFAAFGLIDVWHFDIKEDHVFTEFVGKTMFGTYSVITIIVLINMLIAMLSNSYQIISNDSDTEWKFARSKLWMSFFEEGATVPPPFNIIPTPKTMWYIVMWFKEKLCTCTKKQKRSKWQSIRKMVNKVNEAEALYQKVVKKVNEREAKYEQVMRDLVKRYIMQQQRGAQTEGVTEDDLNEIKQDISSFRYELLEILRNNGMKTPSYINQGKTSNKRMRRKGSRMSIDRFDRNMRVSEATVEQGSKDYMPKFLEKSNSVSSFDSSGGEDMSKQNSIESDRGGMSEMLENLKNVNKSRKHSVIQEEEELSPVSDKSSKRDEGIGGSFDQHSELSDSSLNSKTGNGINGSGGPRGGHIQSVAEEEDMLESGADKLVSSSANPELPLDPSKLKDGFPSGIPNGEKSEENPFNKKPGIVKKVSFLWGKNGDENGEGEDEDDEQAEPISETYHYEGAKRSRFNLFRKK